MNITTHPVAREEVMAFLDGELSAPDAQAVATHLDLCAECANLAEQFRSTSQSLSRWNVQTIPKLLEDSITDLAGKAGSGPQVGKTNIFIRASFWTRKQWILGIGSTVAALLVLVALATPNLMRAPKEQKAKPVRETSNGNFTADGQPITDRQSIRSQNGIVTEIEPGAPADSNGQFRGPGDHAESSFTPDPMIARAVSLSIVVKDFAASRSSLDIILARYHGYSGQLGVSTPENAPRSLQASLRIPAPELSTALGDLKTLGRVENESQSGEEVTQQHFDLIARLKNSRETEQRFRAILRQRTGNVAEVLQVEQGIARVRGDIERMEAEQKALEHRVDFVTVELQLTEDYKAQLNLPAASVSIRVHNGLVAGYRNASETVLGIVLFFAEYGPSLLIWLVILVLPVILVLRRYRRTLVSV